MASVRVAVRVRPLNQRELDMESKFIIEMDSKRTSITNMKIPVNSVGDHARERIKDFTFDYSYWSVSKNSPKYASQEEVFKDLGMDVVNSAYEGYNACVFAYGQTGSGKTYTMMGSPGDVGLIPRICEEMFARMKSTDNTMTYRTEVSYLEIYNEKVRDLLKGTPHKQTQHSLRVREHPKGGPYVQDLSKHIVMNFADIKELMEKGNENRTTACTLMNDVSSRSHAIFTLEFTQAKFSKESPLETQSKVCLVDLAGSERADSSGATGQRLKEGGSINKSLVTLGNVISALADLSEKGQGRKSTVFIPYRDSVLTWLLKDSLGGNAKTIMVAAISPADCNYGETMSTLRYANRAKNIVNKPRINEDPNVKLIRELRAEIARLKMLIGGNMDNIASPKVQEKLHESEARVKVLTEEWAGKWAEISDILQEEKTLALRKEGRGVVLDSDLPHLIGIDDDILSTGIMLYHLKEGTTSIGTDEAEVQQDIVLQGVELLPHHCVIEHKDGVASLIPESEAFCSVNGQPVTECMVLTQGAVIMIGKTNMFRFNHPGQVAKLKKEFKGSNPNLSRASILSRSMTDLCRSTENLALNNSGQELLERKHQEQLKILDSKRKEIEEMEERFRQSERSRLAEQQEQEHHLEDKRRQLERLQEEAETIKDQAEKARRKAERQVAKYKRRSMDAERQLQDFIGQQFHQQSPGGAAGGGGNGSGGPATVDRERILQELEKEIEYKREIMEREKQQELRLLQEERDHLELMKRDCHSYSKFAGELEETTIGRLEAENQRLVAAQKALSEREKELFDQYKREEKRAIDKKNAALKELDNERWKIQADKIYVRELETNIEQMEKEAQTDAEKEQLEREREALEVEKAKIEGQDRQLDARQAMIEEEHQKALEVLQLKRSKQVDELNVARKEVRELEDEWRDRVSQEMQSTDRTLEEVRMRIEDGEEEVEALEARYLGLSVQIRGKLPRQDSNEEIEGLVNSDSIQEELAAAGVVVSPKDTAITPFGGESENNTSQKIKKEVRFSESHNGGAGSEEASGMSSLSEILGCEPTEVHYNQLMQSERQSLLAKMQELRGLEDQLRCNETDLDDKRRLFAAERIQELETLEKEKFSLQEMENQERINSLVEQEVRRRLLQERIEREQAWSAKREKERLDRENELLRIRKSHQRELQKLKDRYEGNLPSENLPTKANPYASITSGDATPGLSSSQRSIEERAAAVASIHSVIRSLTPLTGNPFSVSIPTYLHRGSGFDVYYEYEIKLSVLEDKWTVFRRYRRFRELHNELRLSYTEVAGLVFPPKKFFGSRSERTVAERRLQLENYLKHVLEILWRKQESPLHPNKVKIYCKKILADFNPFFKRGVFETGKYSTG